MVFAVISVLLAVVIIVASVIAIIMSTSHGTAWIQSLWKSGKETERRPDRP